MLDFLNQPWFWSPLFVAAAATANLVIQEWLRPQSQARIERLKMYDSEILAAHKSLYHFVSRMQMSFAPPGDTRVDFRDVMKSSFYETVKPNMLLFAPEIRKLLNDFDSQYVCLGDPDLFPKVPFDEFIDKELHEKLGKLETLVETFVDSVLKQCR